MKEFFSSDHDSEFLYTTRNDGYLADWGTDRDDECFTHCIAKVTVFSLFVWVTTEWYIETQPLMFFLRHYSVIITVNYLTGDIVLRYTIAIA